MMPGYLSLRALASYSGLSRTTLWRRINDLSHPLPVFRVGHKVLVKQAEFDAWMERERRRGETRLDALVARVAREMR